MRYICELTLYYMHHIQIYAVAVAMVPSRLYYSIVGYSTVKTATQKKMLSLTRKNTNHNHNRIPNRVSTL